MQAVTDEVALKLHTDANGHVWYVLGIGGVHNTGMIADTFLMQPVIHGFGIRARLLGTPRNAELITQLYLRRRKNEVVSVEVAGPNICESPAELNDPALVLLRMRSAQLSSACGGWHTVTDKDYLTYALLARMQRTHFQFDTATQAYLRAHPVFHAMTLIPTLSSERLAQLLIDIIDPRWYVDRRAPERASKLELYLGLTPRAQASVSNSDRLITRPRELRCATVLGTWKTAGYHDVDTQDPRNWLYRVYAAAGGGPRGDLRAGQALVRYLRYNWLDALERRPGVRDGLFAPELYFRTPAEIEVYREHMKS
jgi:hypothetical protein